MPEILLPWDSQPQEAAQLRPELYDRLVGYWPLQGTLRQSVGGYAATAGGAVVPAVGGSISGHYFNGASRLDISDTPYSGAISLLISFTPRFVDANPRGLWVKRNNAANTAAANELALSYSSSGVTYQAWDSGSALTLNFSASIPLVVGSTYTVLVAQPGSGLATQIFVNGALAASATQAGAVADTTSIWQIGSYFGENINRYANAVIAEAAMWSRSLGSDLAAQLSAGPGAAYEPRRLWVPSGTIISLPTLSLPTFVPGSITSAGFRPRVTAS